MARLLTWLIALCGFFWVHSACPADKKLTVYAPALGRVLSCGNEEITLANNANGGMQKLDFKISEKANVKHDSLYTLVIVDPDAPGLDQNQFFLHMIVANLKGSDIHSGIVTNDLDKGNVIMEFMAPAPPRGSGYHRYTFRLLKQGSGNMDISPVGERSGFDLNQFVKDRNLGSCVASCVISIKSQD